MVNTDNRGIKITNRMNRVARPIIILITSLVLMLMIPVLSGLAAIPFLVMGQQVAAYIACRLIQNLYGPIIMVVFIAIFPFICSFVFSLRTKGVHLDKASLKRKAIMLFTLTLCICMTYNSFKNIANLILDIGVIAESNYAEEDGRLELYDVTYGDNDSTFIKINDIKFEGGNVQAGVLIEGDHYHVEYLPHTKYVVKYKHIK